MPTPLEVTVPEQSTRAVSEVGCAELAHDAPVVERGVVLELGEEGRVREEAERRAEPLQGLACTGRGQRCARVVGVQAGEGPVAAMDHHEARVAGTGAVGGDVLPSHGTGER